MYIAFLDLPKRAARAGGRPRPPQHHHAPVCRREARQLHHRLPGGHHLLASRPSGLVGV